MKLNFTQWLFVRHPYSDLYLLFVRESEDFIGFLWNCWFLLIQIIVFTLTRIKQLQGVPFLWPRLICVLSAAPTVSLVCPRMGGSGNPGELDFVKHTSVGNFTSTMIPRMGNLTRLSSLKVERIWEWVTSDAPSWNIPRIHLSEFPASKDGWMKGIKECCVVFEAKLLLFYAHQCA